MDTRIGSSCGMDTGSVPAKISHRSLNDCLNRASVIGLPLKPMEVCTVVSKYRFVKCHSARPLKDASPVPGLFLDQFEENNLGAISLTTAKFNHSCITATAVFKTNSDIIEKLLHDLRIADFGSRLAACVHVGRR